MEKPKGDELKVSLSYSCFLIVSFYKLSTKISYCVANYIACNFIRKKEKFLNPSKLTVTLIFRGPPKQGGSVHVHPLPPPLLKS